MPGLEAFEGFLLTTCFWEQGLLFHDKTPFRVLRKLYYVLGASSKQSRSSAAGTSWAMLRSGSGQVDAQRMEALCQVELGGCEPTMSGVGENQT